jgi:LmbE family N-acetylglucosaminyl deacetylase
LTSSEKVLVIAAHPDDEVLGCGGSIARWSREGSQVYIAILGEGETSRYDSRDQADPEVVQALQDKSRQVADILGAGDIFQYSYPDNRFDTVPLLEIVKTVEELINRIQPKIVYTHHSGDLNIDHTITFRAVMTATRPMKGSPVRKLHAFEIPSSTDWTFGGIVSTFNPNEFIDISSTLETKIKAMQCYENEVREFPHPRSSRALRALAERWGSVVGVPAAEAFQLIRSIR